MVLAEQGSGRSPGWWRQRRRVRHPVRV